MKKNLQYVQQHALFVTQMTVNIL